MTALRWANMYDDDPNAHAPLPFPHIVGDDGAPEEWRGQEAVLFHNPTANIPLPLNLFDTVTEGYLDNGQYIEEIKCYFFPYFSITSMFDGPVHRQMAMAHGDKVFEALKQTYEHQRRTHNHPIWGSDDCPLCHRAWLRPHQAH